MAKETGNWGQDLALIEKVNSVFLGTRDFKSLAERAVRLMAEELRDEGIVGVAMFRVRPEEKLLYAYALASRALDAVNKLFPKKFSELSVSLGESSNLLVRAVHTRQEQESPHLYDFSKPTLNEFTCKAIQRTIGFSHMIAYPLRLKQGKAAGVILFAIENTLLEERQRIVLEAFRSQLELAFENVLEFEQVVERYKRSAAKASPDKHEQNVPTVRFTLRITPKHNKILGRKAREAKTDKASLIRSWIDERGGK